MKTMRLRVVLGLGVCVLGGLNSAWAQTGAVADVGVAQPGKSATKKPFLLRLLASNVYMNGGFKPRPDVAALEPRLREAVLAIVPGALVQSSVYGIWVSSKAGRYGTHLLDENGRVSKAAADKFPPGFDEFWLSVRLAHDPQMPQLTPQVQEQAEGFGTTRRWRVDLRPLTAHLDAPVSPRSLLGVAYDSLADAGVIKSRVAPELNLGPAPLWTRRELAGALLPLLGADDQAIGLPANGDSRHALEYLRSELAAELYAVATQSKTPIDNRKWRPPHEYLAVEFSSGQGADAKLIKTIRQVLAQYSATKLLSDTAPLTGEQR